MKKFIRMREVLRIIPVSRSTIWRWVRDGQFPAPIKIGPRSTVWEFEKIMEWVGRATAWQSPSILDAP